jgi:type VI secretion system Hcp family effector
MSYYMRITQNGVPVIDGDATATGHENWIEIYSYSIERKKSSKKDDAVREIVITKGVDSASPRLRAVAVGARTTGLMNIQIDSVKDSAKNIIYNKIVLEDVLISSFSMSGSRAGGDRRPTEQLTLNFTMISFDFDVAPREPSPDSDLPYFIIDKPK